MLYIWYIKYGVEQKINQKFYYMRNKNYNLHANTITFPSPHIIHSPNYKNPPAKGGFQILDASYFFFMPVLSIEITSCLLYNISRLIFSLSGVEKSSNKEVQISSNSITLSLIFKPNCLS